MKKSLLFKIFFLASMLGAFASYAGSGKFVLPANIGVDDYLPNKIILKVKPELRNDLNEQEIKVSSVQTAFSELGISSMHRMFPHASLPETEYNSWGAKLVDITIIYDLKYTANVDLATAINKLIATGAFQYVEPWYVPHIHYKPNDPNLTSGGQYFMAKIMASSTNTTITTAFDVIKGDTNVVIGIIDSGTDPLHPDLAANLKHNWNEIPNNGIDDDNDGYIDNFSGWDVAENDSNTTCVGMNHGAAVSGDAAAVTDNATGVASPGFNCKFLPVKSALDASTSGIAYPSTGIQYAADHGANVINCSFGGPGFSQSQQDVITYATVNKGALVVCSAGNNGDEVIQYPAAYEYVLNVAATTSTDAKASFSSYGTWVGISAPGNNIYSTNYVLSTKTHNYAAMSGTSMASPITAGCAAMVKAKFPSYNPMQIAAQLKGTADNINAQNGSFIGKLGAGRVNLYRAVTESPKSASYINIKSTDKNDDAFVIADTLFISGDAVNFLAPATNLVVTMATTSPYVTVLTCCTTLTAGALPTMGIVNNSGTPFQAIVKAGTPLNTMVTFTFTITDGSYTSTATYSVLVNVDYINITVNDVLTSVTSKGNMAYNDPDLNTRVQGLGFSYKNNSMSYEICFMAGTDASHVSDYARTAGGTQATAAAFQSTANVKRVPTTKFADFESLNEFNDNTAAASLSLLVKQRTFAWSAAADRKFVICQYTIMNNGGSALTNLYAGIFADWDIGTGGVPDLGDVDKTLKLGYVWHNVTNGLYAGTKLLTNGGFNHYAIDNDTLCPGVNIYNTFSIAEKYTTLSTMKDNSGGCGANDVGNVVSSGPFTVNAGDSIVVAFALLAGDNLTDLKTSATRAQIRYDDPFVGIESLHETGATFGLQSAVPNPSSGLTTFNFRLASTAATELTVFDLKGQKVRTLISKNMTSGIYQYTADLSDLGPGIYFYHLISGDNNATGKLTIIN